jgi:hypothetical protein
MPLLTRTVDMDSHKGAFEPEDPREKGNTSMAGQLPHRGEDPMLKSSDTDFPEPGENAEHSGEPQQASLLDRDEEESIDGRKVSRKKTTGKRKRR